MGKNIRIEGQTCGSNSVARVSAFQAEGRRFESGLPLQTCKRHLYSVNIYFRLYMSSSKQPEFTVEVWFRESKKARSISMRTLPPYGVEIVVPQGVNDNLTQKVIIQNQKYINQKLSEIRKRNFDIKPSEIFLPVTNERFNVEYLTSSDLGADMEVINGTVKLHEPTERQFLINNSKLLQGWIQYKATNILENILKTTSQTLNIQYNKVKVGARKSIWGSCSNKQNINLNRNLIFLKPDLIEYVITHELCHVLEMNHSPKFWYLLDELCPNYRRRKTQLKSDAICAVPSWALV